MERRARAQRAAPPDLSSCRVVVYGAYGHTGRFVTAELRRRGLVPILSGRDPDELAAFGVEHPDLETRCAAVDDQQALQRAIAGAAAVINCAGPFLDTGLPVAAAAVRSGVHYLDVAPEQAAVQAVYGQHADGARAAGVAVVPAVAFYGGLADLLATATVADGADGAVADEITVAVALDRWWPTPGTRRTGRRNTARRLAVTDGRLTPIPDPPPTRTWTFPDPFGPQQMIAMPFSEVVTMSRHLRVPTIRSFLNHAPVQDIHDPSTPPPKAVDEAGRSAQTFVVDVVTRTGTSERRITAGGQDIYAVTAPIVVEATVRILDGRSSTVGVAAPGEMFDAGDFLDALSPDPLTITRDRDLGHRPQAGNPSPPPADGGTTGCW